MQNKSSSTNLGYDASNLVSTVSVAVPSKQSLFAQMRPQSESFQGIHGAAAQMDSDKLFKRRMTIYQKGDREKGSVQAQSLKKLTI